MKSKRKDHNYSRSNLRIKVVITKSSGEVCERLSRYKLRILSFSKANYSDGDKIEFRVIYKPGIENEGVYTFRKEFIKAYESFTEEDLIKEALSY